MLSIAIERAVKIWLDEHSEFRACGSCPCGCDDLTRFICMGGNIENLDKIMTEHKEIFEL